MKLLSRIAILAILMLTAGPAHATTVQVLAVVDGTPITNVDFELRRNFLVRTTGIDPDGTQIDSDVMQMLVDDVLKTKESRNRGLAIENRVLTAARELVNETFSRGGRDPDAVLSELGIPRDFVEKKIASDLVWQGTVQQRFANEFDNVPREAESELERITKNANRTQVNLAEIALLPEPNRNIEETLRLAREMVRAIRSGADFSSIARQYSAAGTAQNGGDLGWVQTDHLPEHIRRTINDLPRGAVTDPALVNGAVVIYRIGGIRQDGRPDPLETVVQIGRLVLPLATADENVRATAVRSLNEQITGITSCAALESIHDVYQSGADFIFATASYANLTAPLRELVMPLGVNEKTTPLATDEGIIVFMICARQVPTIRLPSLEEVELRIRNRHFSVLSSRYIAQLRRRAIIEYRVAELGGQG